MGQRSNLVYKKSNEYRLFYNHWCGHVISECIFWGHDVTKKFIMAQHEVDKEDGWLSYIWAEGGILLDEDAKKVLFFGGSEISTNLCLKEAYGKVVKYQWEEWELTWAYGGVFDFIDYLGEDRALILKDKPYQEDGAQLDYGMEHIATIITIEEKGECKLYTSFLKPQQLLASFSDVKEQIKASDYHTSELRIEDFPNGGMHINFDEKECYIWASSPIYYEIEKVKEKNHRWSFHHVKDDYKKHQELCQNLFEIGEVEKKELYKKLEQQLTGDFVDEVSITPQMTKSVGGVVKVRPSTKLLGAPTISSRKKRKIWKKAVRKMKKDEKGRKGRKVKKAKVEKSEK